MKQMITIHPVVFGAIVSTILALVGTVYGLLNTRLKKVEDWKVDKGFCKTRLALIDEKFSGIEARISDWKSFNSQDHARIEKRLVSMGESIEDIKDCMNKIANNREC